MASPSVDLDALRPVIQARVLEIGAALAGAPLQLRAAFRALLGDRRMRVLQDAERGGFRVEGLFELALETPVARSYERPGRLESVVAGGALFTSRDALRVALELVA